MGSGKSIEIDVAKLREAFTIVDKEVEEKRAVSEEIKPTDDDIDLDTITEEEFMTKAIEKIGPVQKTANKTLTKDCFIKIFKYTGYFAKIKSRSIKS